MSNARKLQTEIERCMKKVDEGVELFDEIWEKVYSTDQQSQKEKFEMDLKKEIKKLQRQRDQIKTWISSSEIKDKDPLIEARKLIESKMEQFKICEKETKTKTYSREGLAREDKLDPEEEAKLNTTSWLGEYIEKLSADLEEKEFEKEKIATGKSKKSQKAQLEELQKHVAHHKFHISKLEGIIRLVNNDRLDVAVVDPLRDDLDYYLESYQDEEYAKAYDQDYFYESLGLDELEIVNVDRVTLASGSTKAKSDDATSTSSVSKDVKSNKVSALSTAIPLTIGRARSKAEKSRDSSVGSTEEKSTPSKPARTVPAAKPVPTTPTPVPPPPTVTTQPGTSMAAVLKRETEQQEKLLREQQAKAAQAEQLRQQQALAQKQQQEALLRQQEALRLKQQQEQQAQAERERQQQLQQEAAKLRQQQIQLLQQQQQQQESASKQQSELVPRLQPQQPQVQQSSQQIGESSLKSALATSVNAQPKPQTNMGQPNSAIDILTAGLGGFGLGGSSTVVARPQERPLQTSIVSDNGRPRLSYGATALSDSFATMPGTSDHERSFNYVPQNPYPNAPPSYPTLPSPIFEKPEIFEKLGSDALFFIFYYAQGSYQQYLAARELKKQSWRFHKKYMTWFQRHEEPQITTDEFEQGTYVYFDYETGWCTRIKTDFRFEYSYLEDSLQ